MIEIRDGAARAVARESGFASVRVEDARREICAAAFGRTDDHDAVRARAVMALTNGTREPVQRFDAFQRLLFKDNVIVAEALEFNKLHSRKSGERQVISECGFYIFTRHLSPGHSSLSLSSPC